MQKMMSRLGMFVFYDPQGIVDRYVLHLLTALRPEFQKLIIISNTALEEAEAEKLRQHCDELYFRENKGLDAAAFKQGFTSFCGWEEVQKYDEVVLVNDTFFGPIHSFSEMFQEMSERDVDFWGMSAGYRQEDGWKWTDFGYIPDHIQTFFVAFRQNMVCSQVFQEYWNQYNEDLTTFEQVVAGHEMVMTKYFQDRGFRWDIYADTEHYRSPYKSENFNLYFYSASDMLQTMRFPVLKKKVLNADTEELLYMRDLGDAAQAMAYIKNNTQYDTDLIWDNILRLYNVTDLYHSLNLNYVLPSTPCTPKTGDQAALVFFLTNPFFVKQFCQKAETLAQKLAVYLIPEGNEIRNLAAQYLSPDSKVTVLADSCQQTEMGAVALCCKSLADQYTYLGFIHDLQNPEHYPATVAESTVQGYLQNAAMDSDYLSQIICCFESNPRLGVLGTPFPVHHHGFGTYANGWGDWFKDVCQTAETWKLQCVLSEKKPPLTHTGVFWCRTAALRPLWQRRWKPGDFKRSPVTLENKHNEILKRILPYIAQSEGYYSGIVMHTQYASVRLTEQEFMLQEIVRTTTGQFKIFSDCFNGYMRQLRAYGADPAQTKVDLSAIGLRTLLLIIMDKYVPKKIIKVFLNIFLYCRRVFRRS